tara:strand:+ start:742 stop:1896 length:1155 start_codon:yes stop_codon:yes gene_type:complete
MPYETPILAPAGGYVLWASFSDPADPCPGGITPNGDQGTIIIAHGNDYFTVYLHMVPPLSVSVGDNVETGDTLGFAGNSGCAISTHLHFEIRKGNWFFDTVEPYAVDPFGWWHTSLDPIESFRGNRSEWLWVSDELIDDGDNGFQRFQGPEWNYLSTGFNNDSWSAPSVSNQEESRHYAMWVPFLEDSGEYNIEMFIPEGVEASTEAIYEISVKNSNGVSSRTNVTVDQNINPGSFETIATLGLPTGSRSAVVLRDIVGESSEGSSVVFDAIRFSPNFTTSTFEDHNGGAPKSNALVKSVFPNPFNSSTIINYEITIGGNIVINIVDALGRRVYNKQIFYSEPGKHYFIWNGKTELGKELPSGVYLISFTSNEAFSAKKVLYLK